MGNRSWELQYEIRVNQVTTINKIALFDTAGVVPPISKQVKLQEQQGFEWYKPHVIFQRAVVISNIGSA